MAEKIPIKDSLEVVFSYLSNRCASIFIAGGAVVDFERASDVDLWFGRNNRDGALSYLQNLPYYHLGKSQEAGYAKELVGNGYIPSLNKVIQVMVTDKSISDRMLDFDISTHCIAVASKMNTHTNMNYSHYTLPPKVWQVSPTTLSRYIKICTRYGHTPDEAVVKYICDNSNKE